MSETHLYLGLSLALMVLMVYKFRQLYTKYRQGFGLRHSLREPYVFVSPNKAKRSHRRVLLMETITAVAGLFLAIWCTYVLIT